MTCTENLFEVKKSCVTCRPRSLVQTASEFSSKTKLRWLYAELNAVNVPSHILNTLQHVAGVAFLLNQLMISHTHFAETPDFTHMGRHTQRLVL